MKRVRRVAIAIILLTSIRISKSSDLIDKVASIANDVYKPYFLTTVAWWENDYENINEFLLKYHGAVTTVGECRKTFTFKQSVVFAANPKDFDKILLVASTVTSEAMLVILVIISENFKSNLINFTEIAWKRDVEDIIVVSATFDGTIAVSTFISYGSGTCGDFSPKNVTLNQLNIFKESKYKNFHGCPIRVTALELIPYVELIKENNTVVDIAGIDASVIKLVIERLNASMDIVSAADHGDLGYYINGTARGSFGDLYYNVADVMAPALILTSKRYPAAQISTVYQTSCIVWCLPQRNEIYKWLRVLLPFYNWATPMIIAAAIGIFSTLKFIEIFGKKKNDLPQGILFGIYSLFFGQFYNVNSRYWLINSLFISWVWFSSIFRVSYEGRLVEGLHHIVLEPPIRTIDEAVRAVDEVRLHPTLMEFFRNTLIEKKGIMVTLPDLKSTLFEIAEGKKFMVATEIGQTKLYKKNVQVLDERIVNSPSSLFLRPRWPASAYVSRVILWSIDAGQIDKIMKDYFSGWALQNFNKTVTLHADRLGMDILGSCFLGLSVMYVVCFFIFLTEIFHKYYITRRCLIPLPFTP